MHGLISRLNTILEAKSSELAEMCSPYNPTKLAEMYTELFKKEWKDVLRIQKTSHKRGEKEAMVRLSGMLKVMIYCSILYIKYVQCGFQHVRFITAV